MLKKFIPIVLLCAGFQANASIISGNLTTGGGNTVNLSGLEWLSFDDTTLSTFDKTYAEISDASSIWSTAGWRYATNSEVDALWQSLGLTEGQSTLNSDGVDFLLNTWGGVHVPTNDFIAGTVTSTTLEHTLVEAMYGYPCSVCEVDSVSFRTDFSITNVRNTTGSVLSTSTFLDETLFNQYVQQDELFFDNFASFLVKANNSAPMPEPSVIALFGLGLFGLGFARRRKVQS